jgi:hypothetical protein
MWVLCRGTMAFWMPVPLARSVRSRIPLYTDQAGRGETVVLGADQLRRGFEAAMGLALQWP